MIDGIIERETDSAILFRPADEEQAVWVPRSLCTYIRRMGAGSKEAKVTIESWKVRQLGWQDYDE